MLRRSVTEQNHFEHQVLIDELTALEHALQGLVCHGEVFADLGTSEQVYRCGRDLMRALPTHFAREEQTVLARLETLGPEWSDFAREMRHQHLNLQGKLEIFLAAVDELAVAADLESAIREVKRRGQELARDLHLHMTTEEIRLSTVSRQSTHS